MKNSQKNLIWLAVGTFLFLWISILFFTNTPFEINLSAIKHVPNAMAIEFIFIMIFNKWLWRMSFLQGWLIHTPNLQGTWKGSLQTTWINPKTGKIPSKIPLILVIKQTFNQISCIMHTKESTSYSTAATIFEEDSTGIKKLSYNYTNTPIVNVRHRSIVHNGAAILTIIDKPKFSLKGEYWTNRKSTGSIKLHYESKTFAEDFI